MRLEGRNSKQELLDFLKGFLKGFFPSKMPVISAVKVCPASVLAHKQAGLDLFLRGTAGRCVQPLCQAGIIYSLILVDMILSGSTLSTRGAHVESQHETQRIPE